MQYPCHKDSILGIGGGPIAKTFIGSDFGEFSKKGDTVGENKMLMTKLSI